MSNEINNLSVIEQTDIATFKGTMEKIGQFQRLVRENLSEGKDYGTIPGTSKPTLFKPGAEKILMLMGLQSTYEIIDSTRDWKEGFFQYQVKCTLKKGDIIITQGLGACNNKEKKYVNRSGFDMDNTILKMAKKRSQVDASLTVASLSEIFTQDLEDTEIEESEQNHSPLKKHLEESREPATKPQINLIEKQIMGSHLLIAKEKERLQEKINKEITKKEASEIISWWLGDKQKGIVGEREKREKAEKAKVKPKAVFSTLPRPTSPLTIPVKETSKIDSLLEEIATLRHEKFLENDELFYKTLKLNFKLEDCTEKGLKIVIEKLKKYGEEIDEEDIPY